jgi:hypothetical protein
MQIEIPAAIKEIIRFCTPDTRRYAKDYVLIEVREADPKLLYVVATDGYSLTQVKCTLPSACEPMTLHVPARAIKSLKVPVRAPTVELRQVSDSQWALIHKDCRVPFEHQVDEGRFPDYDHWIPTHGNNPPAPAIATQPGRLAACAAFLDALHRRAGTFEPAIILEHERAIRPMVLSSQVTEQLHALCVLMPVNHLQTSEWEEKYLKWMQAAIFLEEHQRQQQEQEAAA